MREANVMAIDCQHLDTITSVPEGGSVCPTCVAMGSTWVNLRQCLVCGNVGCCDSSPNTHATKHHQATGHPIIRSIMPGQDWMWCYLDELTFREKGGEYVPVDAFFDAGLWFLGQHLEAGGQLADIEPEMTVGGGFPLGAWLTTYRDQGRQGDLGPDERAALESVPGWTW
jgi:Zn-finger in ubiquitin-hydrolases and other protein